jgi:alginate O-acetyltransferase complex protein AlgI
MSFASVQFFFLLSIAVFGYWVFKSHRVRITFLLIASYLFYFEWSYKYSLLLVFSTLFDYSIGRFMGMTLKRRIRFVLLLCSIAGNLGVLGIFKYYNFFVDAFVSFMAFIGLTVTLPVANILLPLGISFYTFQKMSYTIDLYKGRIPPCRSLLQFSVFVAFFPQLVAGPIERAVNLLPQLEDLHAKVLNRRDALAAVTRIFWGLFKKLVVANSIALQVDFFFKGYDQLGAWGSVLGALGFSLQIYCDFSAYSDIAIGTASLFGIHITENFRSPYLSVSPQEFWRRWHMTLSTWFRDYLYIPLGGSRVGPYHIYFNLFVVMFLVGLWHGANYTFVLWGVWHGLALIVHRIVRKSVMFGKVRSYRAISLAIGWILTFVVIQFGWILFRVESLGIFKDMMVNLLTLKPNTIHIAHLYLFGLWLGIVAIEHFCVERCYDSEKFMSLIKSPRLHYLALGFLVPANIAFFLRPDEWNAAFIYFAF